ncbi:MAG: DUF429 domain-containing protein [Chloroflexota bacterium]
MANFVSGSIRLFQSLYIAGIFHLFGLPDVGYSQANLIEVYPARIWCELMSSVDTMPKKTTLNGRRQRYRLLIDRSLEFPSFSMKKPPSHDELDAAVAAYSAYLFKHRKTRYIGTQPRYDERSRHFRGGFIVLPAIVPHKYYNTSNSLIRAHSNPETKA